MSTIKEYCLLTKPGIIVGNLITMAGGFALASKGSFDFRLFLTTILGLSLVVASACVFNNYIDRNLDKTMERTKNRALALGVISGKSALRFAIILGLLGTSFLAFFINFMTATAALFGFLVYVLMYSFLKYRSLHSTLIGSIAGAMPPVVGYCAACNRIDAGAVILFAMIALWQMPHFFSIALYRLEDYAAASIPVLPIKRGLHRTKVQMVLYIAAFIAISSLLTVTGYTGYTYLAIVLLLGVIWLVISFQGFKCANDKLWARKMFSFSLIIVMALCGAIPFSLV